MKINRDDKVMIRAYAKYYMKKYGDMPSEYECSCLIDNKNMDHRWLVEAYLEELCREFSNK